MRIISEHGKNVRVVDYSNMYLVVEEHIGEVWVQKRKFSLMSDDYAFTNASDYARSLSMKYHESNIIS